MSAVTKVTGLTEAIPPYGNLPQRVFITADAVGGVWQYTLDLAEGLAAHGIEVSIAVLGPAPSMNQQKKVASVGARLVLTELPLDWVAQTRAEVEMASHVLAKEAASLKADVIHLNSPALAAKAKFHAPVVAVCHSCVATWWWAVRSGPMPEEFLWRTEMVREGYLAASRLLAPTIAFAEATTRAYQLSTAPLVVRNGRRPPPDNSETPLADYVFTSGRLWDEGKNLATIERAAGRLAIRFLAAGPLDGPNGTRYETRHVVALGRLSDDEIRKFLLARPVFVSTAHYEPFGLSVLEAAQAGCPLVLSDIPSFRELWDGAALFVHPHDDAKIAAIIQEFMGNPVIRREWGDAAQLRTKAYTQTAMCNGVLAVYASLLNADDHHVAHERAPA